MCIDSRIGFVVCSAFGLKDMLSDMAKLVHMVVSVAIVNSDGSAIGGFESKKLGLVIFGVWQGWIF